MKTNFGYYLETIETMLGFSGTIRVTAVVKQLQKNSITQ